MPALLVPVGPDWYAIDVAAVREVVAQPELTPIPTAADILLGLFNLRGDIVPMFDTGALFGVGPVGEGPFAAVVQTSSGLAGLAATGVPRSAELGRRLDGQVAASRAAYAVDSTVATLVDVDEVLTPERMRSWTP